jgi:putative transposase
MGPLMFIRQQARLYPNKEQIRYLNQEIGNQRFLWNSILAKSNERYESEKKFIFYNEAASMLPELKVTFDFLSLGGSQALQQTLKDQDQALRNFLKSKKGTGQFGYPKFKKKGNGEEESKKKKKKGWFIFGALATAVGLAFGVNYMMNKK